jgi:5-methylcytosine-specific restriction endonuclease McrA
MTVSSNNKNNIMTTTKNNTQSVKSYQKQYRLVNRSKLNENQRKLLAKNPIYKQSQKNLNRLNYFLFQSKSTGFNLLTGCTRIFLQNHIESQFTEGMDFNNHGKNGWVLDHIIPLSTASSPAEVDMLFHFSNLRPVWHNVNERKYNKSTITNLFTIIDNCNSLNKDLQLA